MLWHTLASALVGPTGEPLDLEDLHGVLSLYAALIAMGLFVDGWLLWKWWHRPLRWSVRAQRLLERPWHMQDLAHLLFVIFGLHVVLFLAMRLLALTDWLPPARGAHMWVVAHSLVLHWAVLGLVAWLLVRRRLTWREAFAHPAWSIRNGMGWGTVAYLAGVPVLVFYAALYHLWLQWIGHEYAPQDVVQVFSELEPGLMMGYFGLLAVVIAPLAEELLFRGMLLPILGRRIGLGAAIMVTSVLFAVMHFHVASLVPLFVFAILLSLAYLVTRNIVVPIVMHMLFNAISLTVMTMIG